MRALVVVALIYASSMSVSAANCAEQSQMVMDAVNKRVEGAPEREVRRSLRKTFGRNAGDQLSAWIYTLPQDQLTDNIRTAWEARCTEALGG